MTFASANRASLWAVKEVVWGTTPASPTFKPLRYTGESIDSSISTEKSKEIRSDRMVADLIVVDASPSGSFNLEMSAESFDDLIEAALMSAWSAELNIAGVAADISTTTDPTSNLTSGTAGKFDDVSTGQWIKLSGFTSAVNGYYRVANKVSGQALTLAPVPSAAETPTGTNAQVDGCMIRNGVTEQSFTVMKRFEDLSPETRQIFAGMRVSGLNLEMSTGAILTGSVNFMGRSAVWSEGTFEYEEFAASTSTDVLNSVQHVQNILQDGAALGASDGAILSLSVEINNQHREQKGIGVLGNVGIAAGQLMVNCSAQQYFESKAQADKFENATEFSFSYRLQDNDGNTYIITAPKCKYETFVVNSSALDTDVAADTSFTALRDPVTNCMLQVDRFLAS